MKLFNKNILAFSALSLAVMSCFPEQEVSEIDSPDDGAVVTITPAADYSSVDEGDTLWFDLSTDKLFDQSIDFGVVFQASSESDASDVELINPTFSAFTYTTRVGVLVLSDHNPEGAETLAFNLDASEDYGYNFQLAPSSESESVSSTVRDYDYGIVWGAEFCDQGVDIDIYLVNLAQTVGVYDGATSACPVEGGSMKSLADDTYYIVADFYASDIPVGGEGVSIPFNVLVGNNNGENHMVLESSFNSNDAGNDNRVVGFLEISGDGTAYTVYDAEGEEIGSGSL
ncbi:hypothetical protein QWY31_10495 [Cytophagales bacterium LB-30]|uniref:Uncharacterized protein n=1 Tax=Shiella aurantiaca TaxID=3058365 RepID=A0ABT8F6M3_9BACT|nr:hypothetical protein [Shiella aurantiaca]MDN4165933.1 hypothetical protein [Shiella aurantiaca]